MLEAKNSEVAKLMSRLGGVVGKAELLKVLHFWQPAARDVDDNADPGIFPPPSSAGLRRV